MCHLFQGVRCLVRLTQFAQSVHRQMETRGSSDDAQETLPPIKQQRTGKSLGLRDAGDGGS
jgi:hypothetical protein